MKPQTNRRSLLAARESRRKEELFEFFLTLLVDARHGALGAGVLEAGHTLTTVDAVPSSVEIDNLVPLDAVVDGIGALFDVDFKPVAIADGEAGAAEVAASEVGVLHGVAKDGEGNTGVESESARQPEAAGVLVGVFAVLVGKHGDGTTEGDRERNTVAEGGDVTILEDE